MAGIFEGLMLVSDMDGTLLNRQSQVSPENQRALNEFVAGGGLFTIATGRSRQAVQSYLTEVPINSPGILCNGAVIHDFETGHNLVEWHLATEIRMTVATLMRRFPEIGIQVYQGEGAYFLRHNETTLARAEQLTSGTVSDLFSLEQLPGPWLKVLLAGSPEQLEEVEAFLNSEFVPVHLIYSETHYLELLPEEVSKGKALQNLLVQPNFGGIRTIAIGDNRNDLEMLTVADLGIAVSNAHPELKKVAQFCVGDHNDHAVAEVVGRLRRC